MFLMEQGDILTVEHIRGRVLVVSKNFFNRTKAVMACPIEEKAEPDPLHIPIAWEQEEGIVLCEQVKLLDLKTRGYKKIGRISYDAIIDITDAIQGIFDY
ncbi:MAG: type II toxin-antitoxin system PemK/MazF family toxin [Clostridiales bacterium]|nr:type II toxin-antitoxin system PemK/MazF family toxin [Clostridiales bacterium]